jgi:hypothetical protein
MTWVRSKHPTASVAAAKILLERGYGMPLPAAEARTLVPAPEGVGVPLQVVFVRPPIYAYEDDDWRAPISGLSNGNGSRH